MDIDLDRIVVLVGPNNAGKSTVLHAYELVMSQGKKEDRLDLSWFPNGRVDPKNLPQIELVTVVPDESRVGARWRQIVDGEILIRERWTWTAPDESPKREGFDVENDDWAISGVPWGAPGVANAGRPKPHRIAAFDSPNDQAGKIADLLLDAVKNRLKAIQTGEGEDGGDYNNLLGSLAALQKKVVQESKQTIAAAESELTKFISEVFSGYRVTFDAREEEDLSKAFNFFKAGAQLRMGHASEEPTPMDRQGSGAQRTLMWAALRYIAETSSTSSSDRPHLLLLDEPELCLHPNAIRQACRVLYDLANQPGWQVMVTTHSPAFIDLSRDNTTVVRVERTSQGTIRSTTVFRSARARLSESDRDELKLLNLCDPSVNEFFFGGRTVLVEGDTEYAAFMEVVARATDSTPYRDLHVIRARGKGVIALLARILNQFSAEYAVLHDSDEPKKKATWTMN